MSQAAHDRQRNPRPMLGLRQQPGRLALAAMRLPRPLYHHGFGRLLGHTFLLITHQGRKAVAVALEFRRRHPARLRLSAAILGWGDLRPSEALSTSCPRLSLRESTVPDIGN